MGKRIDLTGQTFGDWIVLKADPNHIPSKEWYYLCQCQYCQEKTVRLVRSGDLRSGKSTNCGCRKREKLQERNKKTAKNITGQYFGYLEAIEPTEKRQNTYVVWKCICHNCGKIHYATVHDLLKGHTISCGCATMSCGELKIKQLLEENNIPFIQEYSFNDCIFPDTNSKGYFDFFVNNNYIIEFDGSQHFSSMKYNNCGWNTQENHLKIKEHDKVKNNYCFIHDIPLIRIPYTHYKNINIEDLQLETTKFLVKENYGN